MCRMFQRGMCIFPEDICKFSHSFSKIDLTKVDLAKKDRDKDKEFL